MILVKKKKKCYNEGGKGRKNMKYVQFLSCFEMESDVAINHSKVKILKRK